MAEENGEKNGKGLLGRVRQDITDLKETIKEKGKEEIEGLKDPEKTQLYRSIFRVKHEETPRSRSLGARLGFMLARSTFRQLRERMDPRRANGGVFLGLNGIVVKSHGGADALAFRYALKRAHAEITQRVLERIEQRFAAMPVPMIASDVSGSSDA